MVCRELSMLKIHCTALQLSHMRKTYLVNPAKHNGRPDLVLFHLNHTTQKVHSKQFNKYLQMYSFTFLIFIYGLCMSGSENNLRISVLSTACGFQGLSTGALLAVRPIAGPSSLCRQRDRPPSASWPLHQRYVPPRLVQTRKSQWHHLSYCSKHM